MWLTISQIHLRAKEKSARSEGDSPVEEEGQKKALAVEASGLRSATLLDLQ